MEGLAAVCTNKIEGGPDLSVSVRAPAGTSIRASGRRDFSTRTKLFEKHVINRRVLLSTNQRNDANAAPAIQRFNSRDDDLRFPNINFVARSAAVRYIDVQQAPADRAAPPASAREAGRAVRDKTASKIG